MTMNNSQEFPLAQVLTIATGRLLCPLDDVYKILTFLTGNDIYTHQIPAAMDLCTPILKVNFPFLVAKTFQEAVATLVKTLDASQKDKADTIIHRWVTEQERLYGQTLTLSPFSVGLQERFANPLKDLIEMAADKKIIVIQRGENERDHK